MAALALPVAGTVHVWTHRLDRGADGTVPGRLSADEQARAARFLNPQARQRYVAARGALRCLLAAYVGQPSSAVRLAVGEHGKPFLIAPQTDPPLCFNVSHSGDLALYAFATGREVGVDVEMVVPLDELGAVARRFFAPSEVMALAALPQDARTTAFYRIWTRKEAWLKLRGVGLQQALTSFAVSLGDVAALEWVVGVDDAPGRWSLLDLAVADDAMAVDAAAALAVAGAPPQVVRCRYPDDLSAG